MELNIDPEWFLQTVEKEDACGGIFIGNIDNVKTVMEAEELALLGEVKQSSGGYSHTLVEIFIEEVEIAKRLVGKGVLKEVTNFGGTKALMVYIPFDNERNKK